MLTSRQYCYGYRPAAMRTVRCLTRARRVVPGTAAGRSRFPRIPFVADPRLESVAGFALRTSLSYFKNEDDENPTTERVRRGIRKR